MKSRKVLIKNHQNRDLELLWDLLELIDTMAITQCYKRKIQMDLNGNYSDLEKMVQAEMAADR